MARKTVYSCDQCGKEFGKTKHISVRFNNESGVAMPPDKSGVGFGNSGWRIQTRGVKCSPIQFCSGICIGKFFTNLIKEAK